MAVEVFLGNPPANIKAWIQAHSQPTARATTIITTIEDGAQEFLIEGTIDRQWMIDNGFHDSEMDDWLKTITQVDIGIGTQETPLTVIGNEAFCGCYELSNVIIPNTVTTIEIGAFIWCSSLTSVTIPNSVTRIEDFAFESCVGLTNVTIPNSVISIGENSLAPDSASDRTFIQCTNLTSITFEGKDRATVQNMKQYPFGLNQANENGVTIHCIDGDIQIQYSES